METLKPTYQELEKELDKLKKERSKSQLYLDLAGVLFIALDPQGIVTLANKKACSVLEYDESEILGKNWFENFIPERKKIEIKNLSNRILNGKMDVNEYHENPVLSKSGKEKLIKWHNTTLRDYNGNITGHISSGEDITEYKKAESSLLESEKRYKALFEKNYSTMLLIDPDNGQIIDANKSACNFYGYSLEKIKKMNIKHINMFSENKIKEEMKSANNEKRNHFFFKHKLSNNEIKDVEVYSGKIEIEQKTLLYSLIHDISDKIKIEKALKESEEKFRAITEQTSEGITIADLEGNYVFVNSTFCKMSGYTNKELLSLTVFDMKSNSSDKGYYNRINKNDYTFEITLKRKDKSEYYAEITGDSIIIGNEKFVLGIIRDVTERKKADLALLKSEKALKESNDTKDKFFSIIAHDLKSPFNALLGFSDLLIKNFSIYSPEKIKKIVIRINKSLHNTYDLLENLLIWSQTQRNLIDFNPEKIELNSAINEIQNILSQMAEKKNIQLTNETVKNIEIYADKNMFDTVLRNLISNALKFTNQHGKIKVNASEIKPNLIEITVSDSGIGISNDKISKLFDLDNDKIMLGTEKEVGTGLGLVLCKEFVEKNGGEIYVESTIGKGSKFNFTIPKA